MATITKEFAYEVIARKGYYDDDPRIMRVVEYTNMGGVKAYAIEYAHEIGRYSVESMYVRDPKVIWRAE